MKIREKAYAKLNLTLSVCGRAGGYHLLDSLVCTVDLYDLVVLKKRRDGLVNVEMHGMGLELLPPERNNAVRAAEAYMRAFGTCGADISIYKNIPVGAGMGGSSADAAGVLRGMAKLYGRGSERELCALAATIGSDTPFQVVSGFARMRGRGEVVEKLDGIGRGMRLNFLVLKPPRAVSTAECYARYDLSGAPPSSPQRAIEALRAGDMRELGGALVNDLYPAASTLNPEISTAISELAAFDPAGVCMTGSGSAVFALFENAEFCAYAKSRYRGKFDCFSVKSTICKP